jgi:hypothetical protein
MPPFITDVIYRQFIFQGSIGMGVEMSELAGTSDFGLCVVFGAGPVTERLTPPPPPGSVPDIL